MLTLTEDAANLVKSMTDQPPITGLLISSPSDVKASGYSATTAVGPRTTDQMIEQDGATIYLDPAACVDLEDSVLDASRDAGGNSRFVLLPQD